MKQPSQNECLYWMNRVVHRTCERFWVAQREWMESRDWKSKRSRNEARHELRMLMVYGNWSAELSGAVRDGARVAFRKLAGK